MASKLLDRLVVEVDGRIDGLERSLRTGSRELREFGDNAKAVGAGVGGLDSIIGGTASRLGGLANVAGGTAAGAFGVLAVAAVGLGVEATRRAEEVETAMRRIRNALAGQASAAELQALAGDLRTLADEAGVADADVAHLAETIAKNGAGSAAGLKAMADAALALSDATGIAAESAAEGLDGILDTFGIVPERAREVAATLFAVGEGRVPIEALLEAFGKLAPVAQRNGLAFEDLVGVVTDLLDQNVPIKQVVATVEKLADAGELAAGAFKRAGDELPPMRERLDKLTGAANETRDATGRAAAALKNELGGVMLLVGDGIGHLVNGPLRDLRAALTDGIPGDALRARQALEELATTSTRMQRVRAGVREAALVMFPAANVALGGVLGDVRTPDQRLAGALAADPAVARSLTGDEQKRALATLKALHEQTDETRTAIANLEGAMRAATGAAGALGDAAAQAAGRKLASLRDALKPADVPVAKLRELRAELKAIADDPKLPTATTAAAAAEIDTLDRRVEALREKGQRAAQQLEDRQRAARTAFDAAVAKASPDRSDDLEQQIAQLVQAARAAGIAEAEIQKRVAELRVAVRDRVVANNAAFADDLRRQLVAGTKDAVAAAQGALDEFDRQLAAKHREGVSADPALEAQVRQLRADQVSIAREAVALDGRLRDIRDRAAAGLRTGANELSALVVELANAEREASDPRVSTARQEAAKQRVKEIRAQLAGAANDAAAAQDKLTTGVERTTTRVQELANTAAGLATIFGGAESAVARLFTGVAQLAGGLASIAKQATKAGGLGALLGGGGSLTAIAGAIGGAVAGGAAIVAALTRPDPVEQERARLLAVNNDRLRELATRLGDTDLTNSTGARAAAVSAAQAIAPILEKARAETQKLLATPPGGARSAVDLQIRDVDKRRIADVEAVLKAAGLSLEEFQAQAAKLGITLGDLKTLNAAQLTAFVEAANSAGIAFDDLTKRVAILGGGAREQLRGLLEIVAKRPTSATDTAGTVAGALLADPALDPTTTAGRDAALAKVRAAFAAGTLAADLAAQLVELITQSFAEADAAARQVVADAEATARAAAEAADRVRQEGQQRLAGALARVDADRTVLGLDDVETLKRTLAVYASEAAGALRDYLGAIAEGLDLASAEDRATLRERVRALYATIVSDGLQPGEQLLVESLEAIVGQLAGFGDAVAAEAARLSDLVSKAQTDARRLGLDTPATLRRTGEVFAADPVLQRLLGDALKFDAANAAEVAQAIAAARAAYAGAAGADQERLGELLDFLLGIDLAPKPPEAATPTTQLVSSAQALTEATGVDIADFARTAVVLARQALEVHRAQLAATLGVRDTVARILSTLGGVPALEAPAIPGLNAPALAAASRPLDATLADVSAPAVRDPLAASGVSLTIQALYVGAGVDPTTADDYGEAFGAAAVRAMNAALGDEFRLSRLSAGDSRRG